jgi:hypothetical protein
MIGTAPSSAQDTANGAPYKSRTRPPHRLYRSDDSRRATPLSMTAYYLNLLMQASGPKLFPGGVTGGPYTPPPGSRPPPPVSLEPNLIRNTVLDSFSCANERFG